MLKIFNFGKIFKGDLIDATDDTSTRPNALSDASPNLSKSLKSSLQIRAWNLIFYVFDIFLTAIDFIRILFETFLNWNSTSPFVLEEIEQKFISHSKYAGNGYFVDIGSGWNLDSNFIWTREFDYDKPDHQESDQLATSDRVPIVFLHGMATGSAIWCMNTDHIIEHSNRKVYAIDLLGFARSSRPQFDMKEDVEWQMVFAVERWRRAINLNRKFVLAGHGFGGYLSAAYALHFPQYVAHLMMIDSWGLHSNIQQQQAARSTSHYPLPYWVQLFNSYFLQRFSPLRWLKAAGPWGYHLMTVFRTDLPAKYLTFLGAKDSEAILQYLYHCNVQPVASGEDAFKALCTPSGWAKNPIIHRVRELSRRICFTFVFGSRTWIDRHPAYQIKYLLGDNRVSVHIIQGAGHHVYADRPELFNQILCSMLSQVDEYLQNPVSDTSSESDADSDTNASEMSDFDYHLSDADDTFAKDDEIID